MKKKILISGAGVAGLATALQLDAEKFDIHIVERADTFLNMGFSIILWEIGYDVIKDIFQGGATDFVHRIDRARFFGGENMEEIHSVDTSGFGYSVARKDLIDALSGEFVSKLGKKSISFSTVITDINEKDSGCEVTFDSGKTDHFDLVVLADGIHSGMRETHFATKTVTEDYKVTYAWLDSAGGLKDELLFGFYEGVTWLLHTAGRRAVVGYYNHGDEEVNSDFEKRLVDMVAKETGQKLVIDDTTEAVFSSQSVHTNEAHDRHLVLVGDAYHGHPPTFGVGTSMALEDSAALAEALNHINSSDFQHSLELALHSYGATRSKRVRVMYATQNIVEDIVVTENALQVAVVKFFFKFGGKFPVEYWVKHLFRS